MSGSNPEQFAERIAKAFTEASALLAEEITDNDNDKPFDSPDEIASIRWVQPIYRFRAETSKKRRRGSSAGLWYAYYTWHDKAGMGKPDTIYVLAFVHSAAQPMEIEVE